MFVEYWCNYLILFVLLLFCIVQCSMTVPDNIFSGGWINCGIFNGEVKCWGMNLWGQLGIDNNNNIGDDGNEMCNLQSVNLGNNFYAQKVVMGWSHACALSSNNRVKCWGDNSHGQLGYGDTTNRGLGNVNSIQMNNVSDVDLGDNFNVTDIEVGYYHTCAISSDGDVKCWGENVKGQLGKDNTDDIGHLPYQMGNNLTVINLGINWKVKKLALGHRHSCALSIGNEIKCWGFNNDGQLGTGDNINIGDGGGALMQSLQSIGVGNFNVTDIISGNGNHNCIKSDSNQVKCWGEKDYGTGSTVDISDVSTISPLAVNMSVKQISLGFHHTCVLSFDGRLKCFGENSNGQLGFQTSGWDDYENVPNFFVDMNGFNISSLPAKLGHKHSCAMNNLMEVKCWGYNAEGQSGYNEINLFRLPANDTAIDFSCIPPTVSPTLSPTVQPTTQLPTQTTIPSSQLPSILPIFSNKLPSSFCKDAEILLKRHKEIFKKMAGSDCMLTSQEYMKYVLTSPLSGMNSCSECKDSVFDWKTQKQQLFPTSNSPPVNLKRYLQVVLSEDYYKCGEEYFQPALNTC